MKKSTYKIALLLLLCVGSMPLAIQAQRKDSLAPIRQFLEISKAYEQAPLSLELEMINSTNYITGEQDTLHVVGKVFILPQSSYMQLGELEQLVTDSLAVLVSSRLQRIIVNTDPGPWRKQMQNFSAALLKNASIESLSKKYKSLIKTGDDTSSIELDSRDLLYGTFVSKEAIKIIYNTRTNKPASVVSINRRLLPLNDAGYQRLKSQPSMEKFLLAIEDKGYFLIKEQATSFVYKSVEQNMDIKIPVSISDRIVKNAKGEFEPVNAFKDYVITIN